jgi:hypothetical protein
MSVFCDLSSASWHLFPNYYFDFLFQNYLHHRRSSKGVDYLVEASAAEAEAISATLAAVKARQVNGEAEELSDKEQSPDSSSSNKHSSLIKPDSALSNNMTPPPGVRLHHRAVSTE